MKNLVKSILLLGFFVCLTALTYAGNDHNNGNNENNGHEWCPPDDGQGEEGEGDLVLCEADAECCLYVNVICPISIECDGDQEIMICADQDLTEADLEDFIFTFTFGGAMGADFMFTVTVPEQAETQDPLTGNETALTTTGISVLIDVNGTGHADAVTDLGDITETTGTDFVFTSDTYTFMGEEGEDTPGDCIDPDDEPFIQIYFLGIETDEFTQIGLQRFCIDVHAEYVI